MAPETRSRGVPPPSRVYHSTPTSRQVQFPARRRAVKPTVRIQENNDGDTADLSPAAALRLKQQTLTQLDFVQSSFEEGYGDLGPEDEEQEDMQKENRRPTRHKEEHEDEDEDEPPISSHRRKRKSDVKTELKKRRRTLGDGEVNRLTEDNEDEEVDRKLRRRTFGDVPSSKYHTQTLTQFMGREHHDPFHVLDSDDEINQPDDGFDAWLGEDNAIPPSSPTKAFEPAARQDSVVPQTPTKPIRTEIPSSSQQVTPLSGIMLERYGAPNVTQMSPSSVVAARRVKIVDAGPTPVSSTPLAGRKLVVEDSYASETLGTPSKCKVGRGSVLTTIDVAEDAEEVVEVASSTPGGTPRRPRQRKSSQEMGKTSSVVKKVRISSASPLRSSPRKVAIADGRSEIPDSEEDEDEDYQEDEEDAVADDYAAGEETQAIMDQMAARAQAVPASNEVTTITSSPPLRRSTSTPSAVKDADQAQTPTPRPKPAKRLRRPLPAPTASTQPFESQRLPTTLVQSFPVAGHRTDAIVPLSTSEVDLITGGYQLSVTMSFHVISTVVRFWFWDGTLIQYGASIGEAAKLDGGKWSYPLTQVYELNNPLDDEELALSDISCHNIKRCGYMPPSVASGMLWNLGRTLFADEEDGTEETEDEAEEPDTTTDLVEAPPLRTQGSINSVGMTVSQQVEAQLQSDIAYSTQYPSDEILVPSTPEDYNPTPRAQYTSITTTNTKTITTVRPSQATTASQCSTPSPVKPSSSPNTAQSLPRPIPFPPAFHESTSNRSQDPPPPPSSSSLTFQDYSAPSPIAPHFLVHVGSSSQLLSRSQMLPDSLVGEDDDDGGDEG